MTSEYIGKQPTFEVRAESLKERTNKFFSTYENPSGSEDRIEICLIREGYRAVLMAEEEINRLKEENAKLQTSIGMGMQALEKQIPKKPQYVDTRFRHHGRKISDGSSLDKCYKCPNCNSHIFHVFDSEKYCEYCGQALDWRETE